MKSLSTIGKPLLFKMQNIPKIGKKLDDINCDVDEVMWSDVAGSIDHPPDPLQSLTMLFFVYHCTVIVL